jgi:hypothetical protein
MRALRSRPPSGGGEVTDGLASKLSSASNRSIGICCASGGVQHAGRHLGNPLIQWLGARPTGVAIPTGGPAVLAACNNFGVTSNTTRTDLLDPRSTF